MVVTLYFKIKGRQLVVCTRLQDNRNGEINKAGEKLVSNGGWLILLT